MTNEQQTAIDRLPLTKANEELEQGIYNWLDIMKARLTLFNEMVAALEQAERALHFTREYVGEEMLPEIEGWSWYDATLTINNLLTRIKESQP